MGRGLGTSADGVAAPARGSQPVRGARSSFVLRRARFAPLLPASLLLAVLTSVLVTTALASFAARALPAASRQFLARSPATTIQVSGQLTAAQASADQPVIRAAVHSALGRVPFTLTSARWSDQLALPPTGSRNRTPLIQAAALDHVQAHTQLTAGHWPDPPQPGAPISVVLPAPTAATLHLPVGRVLTLRDSLTGKPVQLKVTGLFRPRDPAAPYWRLSLLGTSGQLVQGTFITYGPILVSPAVLGSGGLPVSAASWLVGVHTAGIPPGQASELGHRLGATATTLTRSQRLGGLQVSTGLPHVLAGLASSLVVARSLLLIGSLQLLLLAIAAAALAARLLTSQRDEETALLSARGVARAQLVRASLAEVCLLAVVGTAAGVVAGCYLADLLISASGLPASGGTGDPVSVLRRGLAGAAWWPAVVIMILVVIVVMWPALRPATPGAARERRGRPAALASVARAGLDVALIALGALAFWELHHYSAVPRLSGGGLGIDPVLAVAPALALAGLALLPLRALPALARVADRLSARGRRLAGALTSWQVSRRPVRAGSPVLVVILAVAVGALVLAQHQSWRQSQLDQAAFITGADVRVDLAAPWPLGQAGTVTAPRGVRSAMPVATFNSGFQVFALNTTQAASTVLLRPDLSALPAAALWYRIIPRHPGPGLALPGRPHELAVTAVLRPPPGGHLGGLSVNLSVQDGWGIVYSVPAGRLPADGHDHRLTATLASAHGQPRYPLRLLGVSLSYQLPGFPVPPPHSPPAALRAASRAEQRAAAGRATLTIHGLATSGSASGSSPGPAIPGAALARWHATGGSTDLANPRAPGVRPAVTSWRSSADAAVLGFRTGAGELVQRTGVPPQPVSGQLALTAGPPAQPIPAIATHAFFASAGGHLGKVIPLPAGTTSVPVRLVAEVRAFPTAGGAGPAVIVDQSWLQEILASQSQPPLPVNQWWLSTGHGVPAGLPPGGTVTSFDRTADGLLAEPLPNVPQLALLVIVAAAALLASIGFLVSVVATVRERRLQDALLAALGVSQGGRAGQLCLEQVMLSLPGAAVGALIGAALAWLLIPAVTLTSGATAPFPPAQVVIPVGWTVLLALGIAAVPVLTAAVAGAYRPDPAAELRAGESG
jgi:hypothetical protein